MRIHNLAAHRRARVELQTAMSLECAGRKAHELIASANDGETLLASFEAAFTLGNAVLAAFVARGAAG